MYVNQSAIDMLGRGLREDPHLFAISSFDNSIAMTARIEEAFTDILEHQPETLSAAPKIMKSVAFDIGYDDLFPIRSKGVATAARTCEIRRDLIEDVKKTVFYHMSDSTRQAQLRLACDDFPKCLEFGL